MMFIWRKSNTGLSHLSGNLYIFESDVLIHKPDVIFIDYALNDWSWAR